MRGVYRAGATSRSVTASLKFLRIDLITFFVSYPGDLKATILPAFSVA